MAEIFYPPGISPIDIVTNSLNLQQIFSVGSDKYNKLQTILNDIDQKLIDFISSTFLNNNTLIGNIVDILTKLSKSEFTDKFVNNKFTTMTEEAKKMKQQELIELYLIQIHKVLQILINIEKIKEDTSSDLDDNLFYYYLGIINTLLATVNDNLGSDGYVVQDSRIRNWGILKKNHTSSKQTDWTNLKQNAKAESKNTLYNLLCLKQSLLDKNGKPIDKITFKKKKIDVLTGEWSKDKDNIEIVSGKTSGETTQEAGKKNIRLLITGFGPSAAGKSYIIGNMLPKLLEKGQTKLQASVPDVTVQIDGEIFRENNVTYTILSLLAYVKGYKGFTNLDKSGASITEKGRAVVRASMSKIRRTLSRTNSSRSTKGDFVDELSFLNTSELKDNFVDNLSEEIREKTIPLGIRKKKIPNKKIYDGKFNVYLPNTLTSSSFNPEDWTWLNGQPNIDFIIYLMIFQCKAGCTNCKGTTVSGTQRAAMSGKAYSSSNYEKSLENGLEALKENKHGLFRLMIHNSGGKTDSDSSGHRVFESKIFLDETIELPLFSKDELKDLNLINLPYDFNNIVSKFDKIMALNEFTAKISTRGGSQQKRTRRKLPRKTTTKKTHKKARKNTSHKTNNKTYTKPRKTFRKTSRKKRKYKSNPKKKTHKKKKKART